MIGPIILASFGSILLAFGLWYWGWLKLRVAGFRVDVRNIAEELAEKVSVLGMTDDPAYKDSADTFRAFIEHAEMISLPLMAYFDSRDDVEVFPKPENPELRAAIDGASRQLVGRVEHYIARETLSGRLRAIKCWLLQPKRNREADQKPARTGFSVREGRKDFRHAARLIRESEWAPISR